jgi:O-antigen/teichoic acid export membrane protein
LFTLSIGWSAISTPLTNTLSAVGRINQTLKLMVMWTILTWVLTPLAMYFFGFNGVAAAAFVISFTSVLPIYYVRQFVKIQVWEHTWRQLLSATIMGGVGVALLPLMKTNFLWIFAGGGLMSATYGASLLLIGREKLFAELQSLRAKKK